MAKANKYRIIDDAHPKYGKKIKAIPNDRLQYIDIKTGDIYEMEQLEYLPDYHAGYIGIHGKRFGVFLFGREYWQYHSFQFGLSIDAITPKDNDKYLDIEIRLFFIGFGIRFVAIKQKEQ